MGLIIAQVLAGLANASALFLVASGLTLIFGVTRIVNFSHGSLYMLGAFIAYSLIAVMPGAAGFWLALVVAALAVGAIGLVIEVALLRRIYRAPELFQLVATFAVVLIVADIALAVWGPYDRLGPRPPGLEWAVTIAGAATPVYDLVLIAIAPLVLVLLWYVVNRTRFGMLVRAASQDREMVACLGIDQARLFSAVFFLGAALAGLGGAVQLPRGGADLTMDLSILAAAFVVVVVGGMGSIIGAYVAALVISVASVFAVRFVPQSTLALMYVIMAAVLLVRPSGLFGRPEPTGPPAISALASEEPLRRLGRPGRLALVGLVAALALLPLVAPGYVVVVATDVLIAILFAVSLHFMLGPGGLVSFGHAMFFGLGAYAAALAVERTATAMFAALALAPAFAGLVAVAAGWVMLRLRGVYFAMLTLAFAQLAWSLAVQWTGLTHGDDGIIGVWPPSWAASGQVYYYLVLALSLAALAVMRRLVFTPFGYALRAGRDNAARAEASAMNIDLTRLAALGVSGATAGLAGGLYVFAKGSVFPSALEISRSFDALIMVFLGGVGSLAGPIAGAGVFTLLHDILTRFEYWRLSLGLVLIAIVLAAPGGLVGLTRSLIRWPRP